MSMDDEISRVYELDIRGMTNNVVSRRGPMALYAGLEGASIYNIWPEEYMDLCEAVMRADCEYAPVSSETHEGKPIDWQG